MNPYRLPPDELKARSFARLKRYLAEYVQPYHPWARKTLQERGLRVVDIQSPDDFARLWPVVDKVGYRADARAFILQPSFPGKEAQVPYDTAKIRKKHLARAIWRAITNTPRDFIEDYRRMSLADKITRKALWEWFPVHFHASTGTTGDPTPAVYTSHDLHMLLPNLASQVYLQPDVPKDDTPHLQWDSRVMNGFPGVPHLAFFQTVLAKFLVGLSCFDTGGGHAMSTERQIELFAKQGFNFLAMIPSYLVYWLRKAEELKDAGRIAGFPQWQRVALGGEPATPELKAHFVETAKGLGAHPGFEVIESFGMTEMKWAFLECKSGMGIHLNPWFFYWELLDPDTKQPVGEGEPGVLTFSHIDWRGTVFTRYWTGDLIRGGMRWQPCPHCGYTFPRVFGPICRAVKDFTKLKGTRVNLLDLIASVRDTPGVNGFQIMLDTLAEAGAGEFGRDKLTLRIAPNEGVDRADLDLRVKRHVKDVTEVTPDEIVWENDAKKLEADLFAKTGVKAEYIIERRKVHV